uniref:Cation-independent mannose-6-phosphate receptor n=1 Tax=Aceria tosichella TaxID=561515 RepID=A0A6G1S980_9ACAR
MYSYLVHCFKLHQLITALFLIIALSTKDLKADTANSNQTKAGTKFDPFHLSWTSESTRFDFVFTINGTISNLVKLDSDPSNYLTSSLKGCANHAACLFRNGTHLESFHVDNEKSHESVFTHVATNQTASAVSPSDKCDIGNKLTITHYCSTHWNPPNYQFRINCHHRIEWHSPLTCHANATNHEHPCHIYEPSGKLIDLTPWILSNGSSYKIDTSNTTIKHFNLNVCNEAHEPCGPNVAACFVDDQLNIVESGYNNLTSIKYDEKDQTVLLTSLGHYKQHCDDSRVKTVTRFICKNKVIANTRPRLVRSTACESIVEWPTVHACPVPDVVVPGNNCSIDYKPLGIKFDIKKLTNNQTQVEIPGIKLDGKNKTMIVGICQPIPKTYQCEGKLNSNTKACLIDASVTSSARSANDSMIVGTVTKSSIRLSDDKIYLESRAVNGTCSETVRKDFNITQQVGTRIEFVCSPKTQDKPTFLGYDDCTYVFKWGSPLLCLEAFSGPVDPVQPTKDTKLPQLVDITKQFTNIKIKDVIKNDDQKFKLNNQEATKLDERPPKPSVNSKASGNNSQPKMNGVHKFFMISLIVLSFGAFIVVIFVLDKKTRLRVTLRQARQAFQSNNQQPYSRVINDLDL